MTAKPPTFRDACKLDWLADGTDDGLRVSTFTLDDRDVLRSLLQYGQRAAVPGTYRRMDDDTTHTLWMSDTPAELRDHHEPWLQALHSGPGARVLIHGLGLGVIAAAMLRLPNVDRVDVVDLDPRVHRLVGRQLRAAPFAAGRLKLHRGDALTKPWPPGTRWSVVWHDIWPTIGADNLPTMHRLHRRFGGRCDWQGSWARALCERDRRDTRAWRW